MEATMSDPVLVAYATKKGSTHEVAEAVADVLRERGLDVEVRAAGEVHDLTRYGAVVIGGALYMGRWHRAAARLLSRHRKELATRPLAVFAMGPLHAEQAEFDSARGQLDASLERVPELEPVAIAVFGGVVDPSKLHFPFNRMPASDIRDPAEIRAWAMDVAAALGAAATT
jgi:menaquinone-dependent protoporphyrinogen oxidase